MSQSSSISQQSNSANEQTGKLSGVAEPLSLESILSEMENKLPKVGLPSRDTTGSGDEISVAESVGRISLMIDRLAQIGANKELVVSLRRSIQDVLETLGWGNNPPAQGRGFSLKNDQPTDHLGVVPAAAMNDQPTEPSVEELALEVKRLRYLQRFQSGGYRCNVSIWTSENAAPDWGRPKWDSAKVGRFIKAVDMISPPGGWDYFRKHTIPPGKGFWISSGYAAYLVVRYDYKSCGTSFGPVTRGWRYFGKIVGGTTIKKLYAASTTSGRYHVNLKLNRNEFGKNGGSFIRN